MAWDVAGHRISDILALPYPDRMPWASGLAWCQWTTKELSSGEAWEHLRDGAWDVVC